MLTQRVHKMFSLLMAFLVLLSTVSFSIGKQFCGEELIHVSLYVHTDHYGIDLQSSRSASLEKRDCCTHEIEVVQGQDQLKLNPSEEFHVAQQLFLATLIGTSTTHLEGLPLQINPQKPYAPPKLIRDAQVFDQVFLI